MRAVHGFEDPFGARLKRQMQIGHQFLDIAVGKDEIIGHVIWMAGGVADALQPFYFGHFLDQPGKTDVAGPFYCCHDRR